MVDLVWHGLFFLGGMQVIESSGSFASGVVGDGEPKITALVGLAFCVYSASV